MIGFICGIIGFVFNLVYIIFSGIVFTSKYSDVVERNDEWIFAIQSSGTTYKCLFYDEEDKYMQSRIDYCIRAKGMYNMEYTAFIFDMVIGFICGLIGLLHLFDIKKDFVANTGLIGLICGIVGFVLTLVYAIFNSIVFTSNYSGVVKRNDDGVFAMQKSGTTYVCDFHNEEDFYWGYADFFELNEKQYNYKHNFYDSVTKKCEDVNGIEAKFCVGTDNWSYSWWNIYCYYS